MTDTTKKNIPDVNAVIRCLDPKMLEALESHGTFVISEFLEEIKKRATLTISKQKLDDIFRTARTDGSYSVEKFYSNISDSISLGSLSQAWERVGVRASQCRTPSRISEFGIAAYLVQKIVSSPRL